MSVLRPLPVSASSLSHPCLTSLWCCVYPLTQPVVSLLTRGGRWVLSVSIAHGDQKRSVTFTESPGQQPPTPSSAEPPAEGSKASPAFSKSPTLEVPSASSATVTADLHSPAISQVGTTNVQKKVEYPVVAVLSHG